MPVARNGVLKHVHARLSQSNPTFILDTPSGLRTVLRKKPATVKVGDGFQQSAG